MTLTSSSSWRQSLARMCYPSTAGVLLGLGGSLHVHSLSRVLEGQPPTGGNLLLGWRADTGAIVGHTVHLCSGDDARVHRPADLHLPAWEQLHPHSDGCLAS